MKRAMELASFLRESWFNWLLFFVLVSLAIELLGLPKTWLFAVSALAIIPLAGLIGAATEQMAHRVGAGMGGFLNATFGNATELIVGLFALQAGLHELVKASISGSIIGNLLLVLGISMFMGGLGRVRCAGLKRSYWQAPSRPGKPPFMNMPELREVPPWSHLTT